jgi:hypothetical protein
LLGAETVAAADFRSFNAAMAAAKAPAAPFEDVPEMVLSADDVDLRVWAVMTSDDTLRTIARLHRERKYPSNRAVRMNVADKVTDVGLKALADIGPHLLVRPASTACHCSVRISRRRSGHAQARWCCAASEANGNTTRCDLACALRGVPHVGLGVHPLKHCRLTLCCSSDGDARVVASTSSRL